MSCELPVFTVCLVGLHVYLKARVISYSLSAQTCTQTDSPVIKQQMQDGRGSGRLRCDHQTNAHVHVLLLSTIAQGVLILTAKLTQCLCQYTDKELNVSHKAPTMEDYGILGSKRFLKWVKWLHNSHHVTDIHTHIHIHVQ